MRSYIERAKDFVKEIYPYLDGEWGDPYDVSCNVDVFNADRNRKVIMRHGIARIALITSDYVVKYDYDEYEVANVGGGESEIILYEEAERDGFAYLFAKVTRYEYNNRIFYIMPLIRGIGGKSYGRYAEDFMTKEEKLWCEMKGLDDLHCNNYGFRNGRICIFDYACNNEINSCYDSSSSPYES